MLRSIVPLVLICGATSLASAQPNDASKPASPPAESLTNFLAAERAIFAEWHIAPIIISKGEKIADIIDTESTALIASPNDCFDTLSIDDGPSNLPAFTVLSEKGLAAALGVGDVATASGEASEGQSYVLDFEDVKVEVVSTVQLRTKLKMGVPECAKIPPFIDASYVPSKSSQKVKTAAAGLHGGNTIFQNEQIVVADKPPPLLIGTLFKARRVIKIRTTQNIDAKAKLSLASKILDGLGLRARFGVSAAGASTSSNTATIVAKDVVPVGLIPAYVVTGTKKLASGDSEFKIASVDTAEVLNQIKIARATEDQTFRRMIAEMAQKKEVKATGNSNQSVTWTLNTSTWKLEPLTPFETRELARKETSFGLKNEPYNKVLFSTHPEERHEIKG